MSISEILHAHGVTVTGRRIAPREYAWQASGGGADGGGQVRLEYELAAGDDPEELGAAVLGNLVQIAALVEAHLRSGISSPVVPDELRPEEWAEAMGVAETVWDALPDEVYEAMVEEVESKGIPYSALPNSP